MRFAQRLQRMLLAGVLIGLASACSNHKYGLVDENQVFESTTTYNNKVDVLLMVDNSSSMNVYQSRFASETQALIDTLNSIGLDYHIAVVSTDMRVGGMGGRFLGTPAVLTRATPDFASLLDLRIRLGQNGSNLEQVLASIQTAFGEQGAAAIQAGFLRLDAMLAVVVLSDEDDSSPGLPADDLSFFNKLKPPFSNGARSWVLNYIGTPSLLSSCPATIGGTPNPGLRWVALAEASGGSVDEICKTSLNAAVTNIKKRIIAYLTDYHLGRKPAIETIKVAINGVQIFQDMLNGWEYIEDGYIIRFHGTAVPSTESKVNIDFTPAEAK